MENSHINDSILSEEILEDQKKNRIDHMTYLPGMENIGSDILDQVVSAMKAYDYDTFTAADVRRALAHQNRTAGRFSSTALSCRPSFPGRNRSGSPVRKPGNISATAFTCSHPFTLPTTVKTTVFTAVSTATTKSAGHS